MNPTSTNLGSTDSPNFMSMQHEIDVPITPGSVSSSEAEPHPSNDPASSSQPLNLPFPHLLHGTREDYFNICLPLYEASITCDWKAAKAIIDEHPYAVRIAITENYETALHVAATVEVTKLSIDFVEHLVNLMDKLDVLLENIVGKNALIIAAAHGNIKMAEILINKNKDLITIVPDELQYIPFFASALSKNYDLTRYLYHATEKMSSLYFSDDIRADAVSYCVCSDMFDLAFEILTDYPETVRTPFHARYILDALVGKLDPLNRTKPNIIWKFIDSIFAKLHMKNRLTEKDDSALQLLKLLVNCTTKFSKPAIYDILTARVDGKMIRRLLHPSGIIYSAAELGNTGFLIEIIKTYPYVSWMFNDDGHSIFHIAVMHRHQGIYNLLYEIGSVRSMITTHTDNNKNTLLHLIGMTSKKVQLEAKSGASLLMQRDLLWYRIMETNIRDAVNNDRQTAKQLFFDNNKDLVSGSLQWMKDSMVVATLIVTVAFAVAFTIPGGYNQDNGFPIFIHEPSFIVFIIADAVSLVSSSTSLLVFLSILTSHHGQRDFLYSLPRTLMIGLVTLFISVAAMMTTFSASFFVLYRNTSKWIPMIISIIAATPVIVFAGLQFPLWLDMFRSMNDSRYIFHPRRRMLYNKNARS